MTKLLSVHACNSCGQTVVELPIKKKVTPPRDVRWVYPRGTKGDLEVWAPSRLEAAAIFRQYGVTNVTPESLIQGRMPYTVPQPASTDFERK